MHVASLTVASAIPLKAIDEMLRMLGMGFVSLVEVYSQNHPIDQRTFKMGTSRSSWVQAIAVLNWTPVGGAAHRIESIRIRLWETDRAGNQRDVSAVYDAEFGLNEETGELNLHAFEKKSIDFNKKAEEQCRP